MLLSPEKNLEELKALYVEGIYQTKALLIREKPILLQSGKRSHIYLNHRHFLSNHSYLTLVARIYHRLSQSIDEEFILGAVESITSPVIVGAMSAQAQLDYVIVRRSPLSHGTQESIYGKLTKPVLLIDDMTSTGGTLIEAAENIRAHGGRVRGALISAYRDDTALANLREKDITLQSIVSFTEIMERLLPLLTDQEREIVQSRPLIFD